ncbi:GGDEF domain-containing protein [Patescibacteria group bacterium]|nr:GGDEF domain-containing protein [Patescibacteria group bacterium]
MERGRNRDIIFDGSPNVDAITGLPFEAKGVRQRLIEEMVEALNSGHGVCFLEMDLNGLKGLNDNCSYEAGNEGIKKFAEEKFRVLDESEEVVGFYFYRPQAGGDEYKAVIIVEKGTEGKERIEAKMREKVEMEAKNKKGELVTVVLSGSIGMIEVEKDGETGAVNFREVAIIFEKMEAEAGILLDKEKEREKKRAKRKTIEDVGAGTSGEIRDSLAKLFASNRRLTEEEIREQLQILLATAKAEGRREGRQRR